MNRVVGLETEYGCLSEDPLGPASHVGAVRNWIFEDRRFGMPDVFQRDWDEPAGNGGFLFNGGRAYVDMGHLEYCTPECRSLRDLLHHDRAGDRILVDALDALGLTHRAGFVRNNIDHFSGATFGCHENYLVRRTAPLTEANVLSLLGFLTLRTLYCGAGRVGASLGAENRGDLLRAHAHPQFQISQRADYINNELFEWVQFNRAIINTRDEPLADPRRFRRLHLLHGDTSVLPATLALKVGTTSLVLDLLELGRLPPLCLADSVQTLRHLSHQPDGPWTVETASGGSVDALEILEGYRRAAQAEFGGRDEETDALLALWAETLHTLATRPRDLVGRIDWITKYWLLERFLETENLTWDDPWLRSQDLEFHHVDPRRSLGLALDQTPAPWTVETDRVKEACRTPPPDTRAHARGSLLRQFETTTRRYFADWEIVDFEGHEPLQLQDPFDPQPPPLRLAVPRPGEGPSASTPSSPSPG